MTFAKYQHNRSRDIRALTQCRIGFCHHIPRGGYLQTTRPNDVCHICPNRTALMREHQHLYAIVGHFFCHFAIRGNHALTETFIFAFDCKRAATIPCPMSKFSGWIFTQPCNEKFGDFFIFHRVTIRRVGDVNVVFCFEVLGRMRSNLCFYSYFRVICFYPKTLATIP